MEIRARIENLTLHEPFEIARGVSTHEPVLIVELEHDGLVGIGEGAPVDYHGETTEAMLAEAVGVGAALLGDDPVAVEDHGLARRGRGPALPPLPLPWPAVVGAAVTAGPGIRSFPERAGGRAGAVAGESGAPELSGSWPPPWRRRWGPRCHGTCR